MPAGSAAAQPFSGGPTPTAVVHSFRALERAPGAVSFLSWQAPEHLALRTGSRLARRPWLLQRNGTTIFGRETGFAGEIVRRTFAARPEGFPLAEELTPYRQFVLAQARAGKRRLLRATVGGRPAWKTWFLVQANECAGLPRRGVTLWLSRRTLLPLRVVVRWRGRVLTTRFSYRALNRVPSSDFRPPPLGARPVRSDQGFRRTSPAEAARHLSYRPMLPTVLPPAFRRAVSGWAPRSGVTGPEGSMPRRPQLFAAVYRRGFERIDVTQRLAELRGWSVDPFGAECVFQYSERATIRGARGWYGIGPDTTPHLFWRQGRVLYTVSGPYAKRDLLAIANSLQRVR